jgi:TRAP transporter 4TM/12TM fusion protein
MAGSWRSVANYALGAVLCLFTVAEINYPHLSPQSQLAIFAALGLVLCYLNRPVHPSLKDNRPLLGLDILLALAAAGCCLYIVVQTEPLFQGMWTGGQALGHRAGQESGLDVAIGIAGLLLILEATRRSIGWALPIIAAVFILYAYAGSNLPDFLYPHRGYGLERIVAQTFLHSQGVFGTALRVMFTYVFLFVVFGSLLQATGATGYIIFLAQRLLGGTPGGPAKVSVLSSGMMGSLSGSAVANTATTGTFTIPMMRSSGFKPEIAGGIEAAASSGGALVPPVMGAGAYMMLELIEPQVTYLQIIRAALLPAVLYYLSLLVIVHLYSRRIGAGAQPDVPKDQSIFRFEGLIFFSSIFALISLLLAGYTVFRAVTLSILLILVVGAFNARTRVGPGKLLKALAHSAKDAVPLVSAASCVGIVIGIVTLTGIGTKLPTTIVNLSQGNLVYALFLIMISTIVLGMGLPSVVCYLLMATLVGPVLGKLGVVPLGAHLFIFYFGMMSMVTPPVALAAYTASSIAGSGIMKTGLAAFRFALVGFTLPYMFIFRPELLMLGPDGTTAPIGTIVVAFVVAMLGIVPFAAGIAGWLFAPLSVPMRVLAFAAAATLLLPGPYVAIGGVDVPLLVVVGLLLLTTLSVLNRRQRAAP